MHANRTLQRGLSLIESMVVLTIVGISLGLALPDLSGLRERKAAESAAAQFETDVQLARSLAVARNRSVRMDFESGAGGSCYVVHGGGAGDCGCGASKAASCPLGVEPLRVVRFAHDQPVQVESNSASIVFAPDKGTVTPTATVKVRAAAHALHQVINVMGRVRSCTPTGMPGYKAC